MWKACPAPPHRTSASSGSCRHPRAAGRLFFHLSGKLRESNSDLRESTSDHLFQHCGQEPSVLHPTSLPGLPSACSIPPVREPSARAIEGHTDQMALAVSGHCSCPREWGSFMHRRRSTESHKWCLGRNEATCGDLSS